MDVGDIGHPQLVDSGYIKIFDQVRIYRQLVVAVSGANPFFLSGPAEPSSLVHDAKDFLVID
jgi:hypothetical protein